MAPLPTSVASEHLFSTAGDIYDEKRNRLAPEQVEALMFVKKTSHWLVETISINKLSLLLLLFYPFLGFLFFIFLFRYFSVKDKTA